MQFSIITSAALALAVSVAAFPAATTNEKRASAGIYFCTDKGFGGTCKHAVESFNSCINLSSLNDLVSSVGPDDGSLCNFFTDFNCQGGELANLITPGFNDLSSVYGGEFDNSISSYFCQPS